MELQKLFSRDFDYDGWPSKVTVAMDYYSGQEFICHALVSSPGLPEADYEMRWVVDKTLDTGWRFVSAVPADLKELEETISNELISRDM